jgi:hypothetical protein
VTPADLRSLLVDFTSGRQELLARHEAAARAVSEYDFNNACQYIIAREETHLTWLQDAIEELGGQIPGPPGALSAPDVKGGSLPILEREAAEAGVFVDKWREPVAGITNARQRLMLGVILGETLEHARLLAQAAAGRTDVLGRRQDGASPEGRVLSDRWVE